MDVIGGGLNGDFQLCTKTTEMYTHFPLASQGQFDRIDHTAVLKAGNSCIDAERNRNEKILHA
jgi:hypothetical protein